MTATEYVTLVDKNDQAIGTAEKMAAHQQNLLHRAFSIFIFCRHQPLKVLMQQRAMMKYHSPGLWTNTCCSHPRPDESLEIATQRRMREELNFTVELSHAGYFIYNAHFSNGLSEHELDHVFIGCTDNEWLPAPNHNEVNALQWLSINVLEAQMSAHPERFTPWLNAAFNIAKQAALRLYT